MIIDSHCHLDYEPLNSNIKSVIKRAEDVGVKYFLTICTNDVSFLKILKTKESFLEHNSILMLRVQLSLKA